MNYVNIVLNHFAQTRQDSIEDDTF